MRSVSSIFSEQFLESFDYFWKVIIYPIITAAHDEIDQEFKNACDLDFAFSDIQKYKEKLMAFYLEKRRWLKKVYLPHKSNPILDIHKLGAILCRSILAHKPIYFDFQEAEHLVIQKFDTNKHDHIEWIVNNIYVNYKIAFYVSCGLVYLGLLYNFSEKGASPNDKAMKFFIRHKGIMYYEKSSSHDSYENSCILALQKNDELKRDFDYLAYAINLFQLEAYNVAMYFKTNPQNEY